MDAETIKGVKDMPREALIACVLGALDTLDCRAGKLLIDKKSFIVVANDEPYFQEVYELIRENERIKGTWTSACEDAYNAEWVKGMRRQA